MRGKARPPLADLIFHLPPELKEFWIFRSNFIAKVMTQSGNYLMAEYTNLPAFRFRSGVRTRGMRHEGRVKPPDKFRGYRQTLRIPAFPSSSTFVSACASFYYIRNMISMRTKYALKALVRLGLNEKQGRMQTQVIARTENIPKKFLEQILLELKRAKMVNSKQGIGGGYFLIKKPKDISVADVYRLFEGAIAPVPCVSLNFYEKCHDCRNEKTCTLREQFIRIREGARVIMSKTTIQSFLDSRKSQQ